MLRSCYECDMVFGAGADPIRVRWFFTDKPIVPFVHCFMSNNWLAPHEKHGPVGEVVDDNPHLWVNGAAPGPALSGVPCGDLRTWQGEGPATGNLPVSNFWGLPLACLSNSNAAIDVPTFARARPDYATDAGLAVLTGALYSGDTVLIQRATDWIGGPGATVHRGVTQGPLGMEYIVVITPNRVYVAIVGTTTDAQLIAQAMSQILPLETIGQGAGAATAYYREAQSLLNQLSALGVDPSTPITFAGHSAGGAVAMTSAAIMLNARPAADVRAVSFGAPKWSNREAGALFPPGSSRRYVTPGDPVPYLPPDLTIYAWLLPSILEQFIRAWARYGDAGPWYQVNALGEHQDIDDGGASTISLALIVAQWVAEDPMTFPVAHGIRTYFDNLVARYGMEVPNPGTERSDFLILQAIAADLPP
jgi:Lipase (class 3)